MPTPTITVYSKDRCSLCTTALAQIEQVLAKLPPGTRTPRLEVVDITTSPALLEQYRYDIPVVTLNGEFLFRYHVLPGVLRNRILDLQS